VIRKDQTERAQRLGVALAIQPPFNHYGLTPSTTLPWARSAPGKSTPCARRCARACSLRAAPIAQSHPWGR
jgi:predicted amidohydrolase YtcJ